LPVLFWQLVVNMKKKVPQSLIKILIIYLLLMLITTVVMKELSLPHTIFLLVDSILLTVGAGLSKDARVYYRGCCAFMSVLCSVFVIHYLTSSSSAALRIWDVNVYFSFCFAAYNIIYIIASLLQKPALKKVYLLAVGILVFLPVAVFWGYYAAELSFLNVDAVMAILQTNTEEALSYVTDRTGGSAPVLMAVFFFFLFFWEKLLRHAEAKRDSGRNWFTITMFVVLNIVLLVRASDNFVISVFEETRDYQANYDEYRRQVEIRRQQLAGSFLQNNTGKPGIYVLVIGESQNPTRMSAYGYKLKTTPWLESMASNPNMLLFQHAYACQVQTVPALTYALTAKNQYNTVSLKNAVSLIDVAKAAGYQTVWLSNQVRYGSWGTPVTVIAEEADQKIWTNSHQGNTLDTEHCDGELVNRLQEIARTDKMLIVVHLMGNHVSYHKRYPLEYEIFRGEGDRSKYDNSILYNDFVMKSLLEKVISWPEFKGLIYFSDHGEGVNFGKSHNPGTFIFDMAYIPMYMYFTPAYQKDNEAKVQTLRKARTYYFTNDLIFNTMLGIMDIRNDVLYEAENDLTSASYNSDVNRFMTLYGKKYISEDIKKAEKLPCHSGQ